MPVFFTVTKLGRNHCTNLPITTLQRILTIDMGMMLVYTRLKKKQNEINQETPRNILCKETFESFEEVGIPETFQS